MRQTMHRVYQNVVLTESSIHDVSTTSYAYSEGVECLQDTFIIGETFFRLCNGYCEKGKTDLTTIMYNLLQEREF